ncbi:MAG: hypothetical protein ACOX8D_04140 [Methanoculleus sp.]|jgi:putative DNA methylase
MTEKLIQKVLSNYGITSDIPATVYRSIDTYFPVKDANALIEKEIYNKHLYRPNTYLHKWWARRSGVTFRYILKQLVDNPRLQDYYTAGGLEGKIILDPMMGGGTTIHEAIRLGANVIGADIDPIPVVQAKATLTRFNSERLQNKYVDFFNYLKRNLESLYKTTCPICHGSCDVQFTLYGLRKHCECSEYVVIDSYVLRENIDGDITICPKCGEISNKDQHRCAGETQIHLVEKSTKTCSDCGKPLEEHLDIPYKERYKPLAIFGKCPLHGDFIKGVDENDLSILAQADRVLSEKQNLNHDLLRVDPGPKSNDLLKKNITTYDETFSARQLLYIIYSIEYFNKLKSDEKIPLALLVSTSLDFNCLLCGYKGASIRRPGAIRHVFSHHAYTFPYTALENNPVYSSPTSGTLLRLYNDRLFKPLQWSFEPIERKINGNQIREIKIFGEVDRGSQVLDIEDLRYGDRKFFLKQIDARKLSIPDAFVDYVVTDPPYYDNVQYSDLSRFFRVWLRHLIPHEAEWSYASDNSAVSNSTNNSEYANLLSGIWKRCNSCLKPENGRLIFTFHHWKSQAWADLVISLTRSHFELVTFYVVESENPTSVHISGLNSLKHDCILICAPKTGKKHKGSWKKPAPIHTKDSYNFIQSCGKLVGWLLQNEFHEDEIINFCNDIIGVNRNDKRTKRKRIPGGKKQR